MKSPLSNKDGKFVAPLIIHSDDGLESNLTLTSVFWSEISGSAKPKLLQNQNLKGI